MPWTARKFITLVALLAFLPQFALSAEIDKHALLGFDMEFSARSLRWLVPYYDLDYLEQQIGAEGQREKLLKAELLEDYVLDRKAFSELPLAVRKKLSAGLDLEKKVNFLRDEKMALVDSEGKALSNKKILMPNEGAGLKVSPNLLKLSDRPALPASQPKGWISQDSSLQSDWQRLNARWNSLPLNEKQSAVKIANLDHGKIADLILDLDVPKKDPVTMKKYLRAKVDVPAWLGKLVATLDGHEPEPGKKKRLRPIEFALDGPAEDIEEGFKTLDAIIEASKTTQIRKAPHKVSQVDTGFHLHIGLKPGAPGELINDLEPVLLEYRRLLAIRMLAAGPHNTAIIFPDAEGKAYVVETAYDRWHRDGMLSGPGSGKGLVRLVDRTHVEIREQTGSPRETYREFIDLVEKGTIAARKVVSAEIQVLMKKDPSIARRIADINPKLLVDFKEGLEPGFLHQTMLKNRNEKNFDEILAKTIERDPSVENFHLLLELRRDMPENRKLDSSYIFHRFEPNPHTRKEIVSYFAAHPEEMPIEAYQSILEWSGKITDGRIDLLKASKDEIIRARLIDAITSRFIGSSSETPEFLSERERFHTLLKQICGVSPVRDPICLIADKYFKTMKLTPLLSESDAIALAAKNIWHPHYSLGQASVSFLKKAKVFSADISEGYAGVSRAIDYLATDYVAELVTEFAQGEEQEKRILVKAMHELRRIGGEPPAKLLAEFQKIENSPNPVIRKAAKSLFNPLRGMANVKLPSACALIFAKIKGN